MLFLMPIYMLQIYSRIFSIVAYKLGINNFSYYSEVMCDPDIMQLLLQSDHLTFFSLDFFILMQIWTD